MLLGLVQLQFHECGSARGLDELGIKLDRPVIRNLGIQQPPGSSESRARLK